MTTLIERMRGFEVDHEPDGWPGIRMREVSALCDALEAAQKRISEVETALEDCNHHAKMMRMWNGQGWTYHPPYAGRIYDVAERVLDRR